MSKFRVSHIPQVPGMPFEVETETLDAAVQISDALAYYDLFQMDQGIRGDFSNVSWIEGFVDGEWEELDEYEIDQIGAGS